MIVLIKVKNPEHERELNEFCQERTLAMKSINDTTWQSIRIATGKIQEMLKGQK